MKIIMTETENRNENNSNEKILKKEISELKLKIERFKLRPLYFVTNALCGAIIFNFFSNLLELSHPKSLNDYLIQRLPTILFGALFGLGLYIFFVDYLRINLSRKLRFREYKLIEIGTEELQENFDENFFTKLVQINFKYIDLYYRQTQEQANKSFRLASTASIIGLTIIIFGILLMFFDKTQSAYVTTATGVISEIIAALFFYLYNKTILKMSSYHQKLVMTQNISLALKISEDVSTENRDKIKETLIDRLTLDVNKYLSSNE